VAGGHAVTQPLRARAAAMVERVTLEAVHHLGWDDAVPVRAAVTAALARRDAQVGDDHDPRYLHPARTVLILLSDAVCRQPHVLAAAAFVESIDAGLAPDAATLAACAGTAAADLLRAVPLPADGHDDELLERLVSAPPEAGLVALAERLDHARHLHLRDELPWLEFHTQIESVYAAAAARLSPALGRRFDRWVEAFGARRLLRQRSGP
jgi:hypothetical protein